MKKLLSFYLLVCTSLIVLAQQSYYDGIDFEDIGGLELKDELATRITTTHTTKLTYTPGVWEACKATDVNPNDPGQVILLYGWEAGNDNDITNDKYMISFLVSF